MRFHSGTSPILTHLGQKKVSLLVRCPDFRSCNVHKQGVWDSKSCLFLSRCPHSGYTYICTCTLQSSPFPLPLPSPLSLPLPPPSPQTPAAESRSERAQLEIDHSFRKMCCVCKMYIIHEMIFFVIIIILCKVNAQVIYTVYTCIQCI